MLKKIDINNDSLYGGSSGKPGKKKADNQKVLACLDDECSKLLVYACQTLFVKHYAIENHGQKVKLVNNVDIISNYQDANEKQLYVSDQDEITDMRYTNNDFSEVRLDVYQQGQAHHLDVKLGNW